MRRLLRLRSVQCLGCGARWTRFVELRKRLHRCPGHWPMSGDAWHATGRCGDHPGLISRGRFIRDGVLVARDVVLVVGRWTFTVRQQIGPLNPPAPAEVSTTPAQPITESRTAS